MAKYLIVVISVLAMAGYIAIGYLWARRAIRQHPEIQNGELNLFLGRSQSHKIHLHAQGVKNTHAAVRLMTTWCVVFWPVGVVRVGCHRVASWVRWRRREGGVS
jgi:hypothetical protein